MYVICPTSNVGSPQKRDRVRRLYAHCSIEASTHFFAQFLALLSDVAETTAANELSCQAYAWFRSSEENNDVPHHWVQGLEVYDHLEASTVTHRASGPYKSFRQACAAESLLERGSDLRYLEPLGIGFLARQGAPDSCSRHCDGEGYVVIERLKAAGGIDGKNGLLKLLRGLESTSVKELDKSTLASFWVLGYRAEDCDSTIVVFQRFATKQAFQQEFLKNESVQIIRYVVNFPLTLKYDVDEGMAAGRRFMHCASGNRSPPGEIAGLDSSGDHKETFKYLKSITANKYESGRAPRGE